jgi:hypothetical protein
MSEEEPAAKATPKRMKKREMERRRRQQVRVWMAIGALLIASSAVTAVILTLPPPPAPGPGVVTSNTPMHIHPRLTILVDGTERPLPSQIGIQGGQWASHDLDHYLDTREGATGTLSPLHTHDSSGVIHVEAAVTRGFTLGEFFDVWGQPLGPSQALDLVADSNHALTLTVDNQPSSAWRDLVLRDNQQIVITYRTV